MWPSFVDFRKDVFRHWINPLHHLKESSEEWNIQKYLLDKPYDTIFMLSLLLLFFGFFSVYLYTVISQRSTYCLLCSIQLQGHKLNGRGGVHLCYLCHVLHPCQLCPLPHPRAGEQSQASAICQRSKPGCVLAGQFCLGHGRYQLCQAAVSSPHWSLLLVVVLSVPTYYLVRSIWEVKQNKCYNVVHASQAQVNHLP